jgi:hypothetical protein
MCINFFGYWSTIEVFFFFFFLVSEKSLLCKFAVVASDLFSFIKIVCSQFS